MFGQNLEEVEVGEEADPQEVEEEEDQWRWEACLLEACPSSGQLEVSVSQLGFLLAAICPCHTVNLTNDLSVLKAYEPTALFKVPKPSV